MSSLNAPAAADQPIELLAADGWRLGALLRPATPSAGGARPGVLCIAGSRHQRDAYGPDLPTRLAAAGFSSLRLDIRGRGASRGGLAYARMAPRQRERVALDLVAGLDRLAADAGADTARLVVLAEQDTASVAVRATVPDARVEAIVVLSPRLAPTDLACLESHRPAVLALVSKEDRRGLRGAADAYLAGSDASRFHLLDGLGFGATMLASRRYEQPDEPPLEELIVDWLLALG